MIKTSFEHLNIRISSIVSRFGFRISSFKKRKGGFTIVELIVVLAVAAMILSGVLVAFQTVRMRGRDATREQQMKALQAALSLYVNVVGRYPIYDGVLTGSDAVSVELKAKNAISDVPRDPLNAGNYHYRYVSADGASYALQYYLETNSIPGKSSGVQEAGP